MCDSPTSSSSTDRKFESDKFLPPTPVAPTPPPNYSVHELGAINASTSTSSCPISHDDCHPSVFDHSTNLNNHHPHHHYTHESMLPEIPATRLLRCKYLFSVTLNMILLFLILPIAILALAANYNCSCGSSYVGFYEEPNVNFSDPSIPSFENATITASSISLPIPIVESSDGDITHRSPNVAAGAAVTSLSSMKVREISTSENVMAPPRYCITGFSKQNLEEMFKDVQTKNENKGKVFTAPCWRAEGVKYDDEFVGVEYGFLGV